MSQRLKDEPERLWKDGGEEVLEPRRPKTKLV